MKRLLLVLFLAYAFAPLAFAGAKKDTPPDISRTYDPSRNAAKDFAAAIEEAHATDRNILLDVGGSWCKWCGYLDKFFADHEDLRELRDRNFVVMYVYYRDETTNQKFLAQFPAIKGCPHLFVLTADGKILKSQDTAELEDGKSSYVPEKIRAFLTEYGPDKH